MTKPSPFLIMSTTTLVISTIMAMTSTNWLMIWLAMELNLISFIPIINSSTNFQETEASVKYLLTQALGSSLLILSSMTMWLHNQIIPNMTVVLLFSLLIKIGMAPCHFWYPSVMTSINWMPALVLSTWQKLAPLSIMSFLLTKTSPTLMLMLASLNAITGGLMGMNQTHLRTIMAYSSITHMGWMLALMYVNMATSTMIYFLMYSILITPIFFILFKLNNKTLSQMNTSTPKFKNQFILLPMLFLSLGGLPPLTGFFPKWFTIYLISPSSFILLMFLIAGSLMNLYFYLNIVFSVMLSSYAKEINWSAESKFYSTNLVFMSTLCIPLVPLLMI